jgi:hypothetical protein
VANASTGVAYRGTISVAITPPDGMQLRPTAGCSGNAARIRCTAERTVLRPGTSNSVSWNVRVFVPARQDPGSYTGRAHLTATPRDASRRDNTTVLPIQVRRPPPPRDFDLDASLWPAQLTTTPREPLATAIATVANRGPAAVEQARLTLTLPPGVTVVTDEDNCLQQIGDNWSCRVPGILQPPGAGTSTYRLAFTVRAAEGATSGRVHLRVAAPGPGSDRYPSNNTASIWMRIESPPTSPPPTDRPLSPPTDRPPTSPPPTSPTSPPPGDQPPSSPSQPSSPPIGGGGGGGFGEGLGGGGFPSPTPSGPPPPHLASTGAGSAVGGGVAGVVLVAAGGGLLLLLSRRHQR